MECEWCGGSRKVSLVDNLPLCANCESEKEKEDAFDRFFADRSLNGKGNMEAFFNSIGHMFIENRPNMIEYLFS